MASETQLWYWLLFDSPLSTLQAKQLLERWQARGISVAEALDRLPTEAQSLGLDRKEAAELRPPISPGSVRALRWNAPLYPDGLRELPLKRRPALLFFRGDPQLLTQPILYLVSGTPREDELATVREAIAGLLGEDLLFAAHTGSPQATLLLEEMAYSAGEALLFPPSGLGRYSPTEAESQYLDEDRLLLTTPLPPGMDPNPTLEPLLQQIATAASVRRIITTHRGICDPGDPPRPTLVLSAPDSTTTESPMLKYTDNPADLLLWVQDPDHALHDETLTTADDAGSDSTPLSPEETLELLEKGGSVPAALRARLMDRREE